MKKVTIEILDGYDDVISFTLIGQSYGTTNVKVSAHDLSKGTYFTFDECGNIVQFKEVEETPKGQWNKGLAGPYFICSECSQIADFDFDFCPNCGVKMKEVE